MVEETQKTDDLTEEGINAAVDAANDFMGEFAVEGGAEAVEEHVTAMLEK